MSHQRRPGKKKRQTQLSFSPLPSSSPAAAQYPEQIARRAASVRYDESPTKKQRVMNPSSSSMFRSPASSPIRSAFKKQNVQVVIQSPKNDYSQLPTPAPSSQMVAELGENDKGTPKHDDTVVAGEGGAIGGSPILSATTRIYTEGEVADTTSDDDIAPIRSSRRIPRATVMSSSDEDLEPCTPTKGSRAFRRRRQQSESAADLATSRDARSNARSNEVQATPRKEIISSSTAAVTPSKPTNTVAISSGAEDMSSEDEDVVVTSARRRRSTAPLVTPNAKVDGAEQSEANELDDEVADLNDTDTEIRETRTRGLQHTLERSERQRKLEELRQRRAGIRVNSGADSGDHSNDDVTGSEPESIDLAMRGNENLDEYEDDFLDDENDTLGIDLGVAGVPLDFTYHANKKPFAHFKTEIEWMVHNKLNPAFERRDEIYLLAHRKLDDLVRGLASSKFSSSVWKDDFLRALNTHPEIFRIDIPAMLEHTCDACKRTGHPPKHHIILRGKPYHEDTLETIEKDDDEDKESDSDDTSSGDKSNKSIDEESFFLGRCDRLTSSTRGQTHAKYSARFCCANAEMAHALRHWRYNLNDTVLQWLAGDGHLTPENILAREKKSQKKREKEANKVVDEMEANGVIKELYQQFKQNIQAAMDSKPKHFSNRR
ncbi:hypothetical protein ACLMJK_000853 [Lecanora helva]